MVLASARVRHPAGTDAAPQRRQGVTAISGPRHPIDFAELQEKLVTIAMCRHGLTGAGARAAFKAAAGAFDAAGDEDYSIHRFLPLFHEKCVEQVERGNAKSGRGDLLTVLRGLPGRQVLGALSRISPETRATLRALLDR